MATRYEGENGEPDLELVDQVNTYDLNESGKGYHGKLSTSLKWHTADPVDSFEINRNNVIYSFQKNRNPFIDHPEYVESIWGAATSTLTINEPAFSIYPNPASDYINIEVPNNETAQGVIYTLSGEQVQVFQVKNRVSIESLKSGLYVIQITTNTSVFKTKLIIQ